MKQLYTTIILLIVPFTFFGQNCIKNSKAPETEFKSKTQFARFETGWYDEWLEFTNGEKVLPEPLPLQPKWEHPYMKTGYTAAMHEGPRASDVSNRQGPILENLEVQYFHVLQKGGDFSGMCPTFAFIDDTTLVTLSFGRANTTLLLLDIKDTISVLDFVAVPGRGSSAFELAGKKGRSKIFSNTAGGAYSYLSENNNVWIPGANSNVLRILIEDRKFIKDSIGSINLKTQIEQGNLVDPYLSEKDNLNTLTALIPDVNGNVWFTSRKGVVGMIHRTDRTPDGCPKVYATFIGYFAVKEKVKRYFPESVDLIDEITEYIDYDSISIENRTKARELLRIDKDVYEEIQNSFSVGKDGVYIVSNFALYKFRFNDKTKRIEIDLKWTQSYSDGELIYHNDLANKPGHLNAGSGTTPTLMDDRFVAICDNDTTQINLCIFSQETGKLVSKLPLFGEHGSAVENSAVAYGNSIVVGNTYGYTDPFDDNPTPGGIMKFDYDEKSKKFHQVENWPESGLYDCKTATPKLSTRSGMLYVYNKSDTAHNKHYDWQITGIDYRTGRRVAYIKPYFEKGEFEDNIGPILKWGSLGSKNYDRKVFNNIWGTFTFGPNNSFYIGSYRGFIRVSSDTRKE